MRALRNPGFKLYRSFPRIPGQWDDLGILHKPLATQRVLETPSQPPRSPHQPTSHAAHSTHLVTFTDSAAPPAPPSGQDRLHCIDSPKHPVLVVIMVDLQFAVNRWVCYDAVFPWRGCGGAGLGGDWW